MTTNKYVAISSVSKTWLAVPWVSGATYDATFSTVSAALADATHGARNLVTLDQVAIYEGYKNVSPLSDSFTISSSWTTWPVNNIIIRPAAWEWHTGKPNTWFKLKKSVSYGAIVLSATTKDVLLYHLEVENTASVSASCIGAYSKTVVDGCIVKSWSKTYTGSAWGVLTLEAWPKIINNIAYDSSSGFWYYYYVSNGIIMENNAAIDCYRWFIVDVYSNAVLKNCVAANCTTWFYKDSTSSWTGSSNNASTDTTAPWTSSIQSIVANDCFVNPAGYDMHMKAWSPLIGVGANTSAEWVLKDIDEQPWTVPYSIGADQPWTFTVPIIIRGVPTNTEIRVYKVSDGSELIGIESSSTTNVTLDMPYTWPVTANIRILNLWYDFLPLSAEIWPNGVDFPISMRPDRWYSNPV